MTEKQNNTKWTVIEVLGEAANFLKANGIENSRLNAERLLGFLLELTRVQLYCQFDRPLALSEREGYKKLLRRRSLNEPLQYILGYSEFMSLDFSVNSGVLIPRPETETLVEQCIKRLASFPAPRVLDAGTGTGCIAISLLKNIAEAVCTAADIDERALQTAKTNAERHAVERRITFRKDDMCSETFLADSSESFDLIVSNPPYIAQSEWDSLPEEIKEFEPRYALCDEGDGLKFYRCLAEKSSRLLKQKGFLIVETGDKQAEKVAEIFKNSGLTQIHIKRDLNGIPRVVEGIKA